MFAESPQNTQPAWLQESPPVERLLVRNCKQGKHIPPASTYLGTEFGFSISTPLFFICVIQKVMMRMMKLLEEARVSKFNLKKCIFAKMKQLECQEKGCWNKEILLADT